MANNCGVHTTKGQGELITTLWQCAYKAGVTNTAERKQKKAIRSKIKAHEGTISISDT
jgi:hypothetical protein